jgi:hypothetical protein
LLSLLPFTDWWLQFLFSKKLVLMGLLRRSDWLLVLLLLFLVLLLALVKG